MKITIKDIPEKSRTREYIMSTYHVSKVTAWRLLSGRVQHICPGYHTRDIKIANDAWEIIASTKIEERMRNCIVFQLRKWGKPVQHMDDISQECIIRAYEKSGIWSTMPEAKRYAYISTLAKRTTNDYMKKYIHYTDKMKQKMYLYDEICYGAESR